MIGSAYDYIVIGSAGFAQLGQPQHIEKEKAEHAILMPWIEERLPVPEEFIGIANYRWMGFPYEDLGKYHEVVIWYNRDIVDDWEENDPDKYDRFYDWANEAESLGAVMEDDEDINQKIKDYFLGKVIDIKKSEHLSIVQTKMAI